MHTRTMEAEVVDLCKHTRVKSECRTCKQYCLHQTKKRNCRVCSPHAFCTHGILGYRRKNTCKTCKGGGNLKLNEVNLNNSDDSGDDDYGREPLKSTRQTSRYHCSHGKYKGDCRVCSPHMFCTHGNLGYRRKRVCGICNGSKKRKLSEVDSDNSDSLSDEDHDYNYDCNRDREHLKLRGTTNQRTTPCFQYSQEVHPLLIVEPPTPLLYSDDVDSSDLRIVSNRLKVFYFLNYTGGQKKYTIRFTA